VFRSRTETPRRLSPVRNEDAGYTSPAALSGRESVFWEVGEVRTSEWLCLKREEESRGGLLDKHAERLRSRIPRPFLAALGRLSAAAAPAALLGVLYAVALEISPFFGVVASELLEAAPLLLFVFLFLGGASNTCAETGAESSSAEEDSPPEKVAKPSDGKTSRIGRAECTKFGISRVRMAHITKKIVRASVDALSLLFLAAFEEAAIALFAFSSFSLAAGRIRNMRVHASDVRLFLFSSTMLLARHICIFLASSNAF